MTVAPTSFPRARVRPALQATQAGAAAVVTPSVKLWPFAVQETTPGDRICTSGFFKGPAVVDSIFLIHTDDSNAPDPTITMWYGPTGLPTGNQAVANLSDLGTPFFTEGVVTQEVGGTFQTPLQHIPAFSFSGGTRHGVLPIRFPIYLQQFQITLRLGTQGVGSHAMAGYVRVVEGIALGDIPNFL